MAVICAVNIVWTLFHSKPKKRTIWSSVWFKPMMCHTSGHQDVCVTSKDAKTVQIWNQRDSSVGSGQPLAKRCKCCCCFFSRIVKLLEILMRGVHFMFTVRFQTVFQPDGATIHGAELVTRKSHNQIMLNTISIKPANHVCLYSTMFTTTVLHGMMLLATTKNRLSAKIPMNCWTMSVSWS